MKSKIFVFCFYFVTFANISSALRKRDRPSSWFILDGKNLSFPNLNDQYEKICQKYGIPVRLRRPAKPLKNGFRVGIVGGGMAGLYSGLLLKSQNVDFHIFEANPERVGGRIYTYRFEEKKNQYFEAGAMRIPVIADQDPFFQLVDYVNEKNNGTYQVKLVDYVLNSDNNYVFVNGVRNTDGSLLTVKEARDNPAKLNFPVEGRDKNRTAEILLLEAIKEYIYRVIEHGLENITDHDSHSMRSFLALEKGWLDEKIDYVETMTSQTGQFDNSFLEIVMEYMNFANKDWKTIEDGMSRLPDACRKIIGEERLTLGAKVYKIEENYENVKIHYERKNSSFVEQFDAIILALPPAVIRFLDKPLWSAAKEIAIRSVHFEPLFKIGLRFKSRFWEKVDKPSLGGQSITDLPGRWIVYPSYGRGDDDEGVLLCYSWMEDALKWLPKSPKEQEQLALRDLTNMYGPVVADQFIESKSISWATEWSLGDAHFDPGQFKSLFNVLQNPERNIFFAGEHLSIHHTWILGAIDSALKTCRMLLNKPNLDFLQPDNDKN